MKKNNLKRKWELEAEKQLLLKQLKNVRQEMGQNQSFLHPDSNDSYSSVSLETTGMTAGLKNMEKEIKRKEICEDVRFLQMRDEISALQEYIKYQDNRLDLLCDEVKAEKKVTKKKIRRIRNMMLRKKDIKQICKEECGKDINDLKLAVQFLAYGVSNVWIEDFKEFANILNQELNNSKNG